MNWLRYSVFIVLIFTAFVYGKKNEQIVRARVESCPGCQLNKLISVKSFIFEDLPKYKNTEFKKIPGAYPEMVFLNKADEELERIPLKTLSREECNDLLIEQGFKLIKNTQEL